jgi:hypothetical protein
MLLWLAILLAIAWVFGFGVYHVGSAAIHLLLVLALVTVILYFVRGASSRRVV